LQNDIISTRTERNTSIELLRLLATGAVIFHHSVFPVFLNQDKVGDFDWWIANILRSLTMLAVPLFIIMSGAVQALPNSPESTITYLKKRFSKVVPAYVLWSIIAILFRLFYKHESVGLVQAAKELLTGQAYFHLYFIPIILGLYCVTPLFRKIMVDSSRKKKMVVIAIIFSTIYWLVADMLFKVPFKHSLVALYFLPYNSLYLLGSYLRNSAVGKEKSILILASAGVLVLLSSFFIFRYVVASGSVDWDIPLDRYYSSHLILLSIGVFVSLKSLLTTIQDTEWLKKIVSSWSGYTFTVYLMHPLILDILGKTFNIEIFKPYEFSWLRVVLVPLATIIICFSVAKSISLLFSKSQE
jgi:surface polysaccharide O-acyltransferase-like enzyme